jgi:hypothetical protein
MKELEMLKALARHRQGEQVTIHTTASGQFVVFSYSGLAPSQAATLEEAINDYHSRLMGFTPATVLHKKVEKTAKQ